MPTYHTTMTNLRSCRPFGDKGPQHGEAILLKRNPSDQSVADIVLHLSLYNAESVVSPVTGSQALYYFCVC